MAHYVKCPACGRKFDRDRIPNQKIGARYYHLDCFDTLQGKEQEDIVYDEKIWALLKEKSNDDYDYMKMSRQRQGYIREGCTKKGIYRALVYWYEIQNHPYVDTLGIVPYIYKDANKYFDEMEKNSAEIEKAVTRPTVIQKVDYEHLGLRKKERKAIDIENL